MGSVDLATLVRICDPAGRPRGTGFVADDRGTVVTSHEAVDGLARLVLHGPGSSGFPGSPDSPGSSGSPDSPGAGGCSVGADAVTAFPESGLALVRTEGLGVRPLPIAARREIEAGTYVRIAAHGWREARVLAPARVTYTATDRFHVLGDAVELAIGTEGAEALRHGGQAAGGPVLDPATGAVLAVLGTALHGDHRAAGYALPLATAGPLAELLRRNAATVPCYGHDLNLAGVLELTATSTGAAAAPTAWPAPEPVERAECVREFAAFAAGDALVLALVGVPGTGRTTALAAHCAHRARGAEPAPTLWLRGADLRADDASVADAVGRALRQAGRIVATSGALGDATTATPERAAALARAADRPLLLILDGPEEMPPALAHRLAAWTTSTESWLRAHGARLMLGCRPEHWEQASGLYSPSALHSPARPALTAPRGVAADPAAGLGAGQLAAGGRSAGSAAGHGRFAGMGDGLGLAGPHDEPVPGAAAGARQGVGGGPEGRPASCAEAGEGRAPVPYRGSGMAGAVVIGDLGEEEARLVRQRYGLDEGGLAAADARHPLALRLLAEVREALPGEVPGRPGREDVFSAHLDLMCLRVAVRIAAGSRPLVRGTAVRRLAARVAGRVHEAARRCLGPGQGELDRESFEEMFPWRTGWASAVLTEGLLVPAGPGYRFGHEELADWLQGAHLDVDGALHALVHRWHEGAPVRLPSRPPAATLPSASASAPASAPAGGAREEGPREEAPPGEGPCSLPVPRHRVGPVLQALLLLDREQGPDALALRLAGLADALARLAHAGLDATDGAWWGGRLLADSLRRVPDPKPYLPVLRHLADLLGGHRPPEGRPRPADAFAPFGPGFWEALRVGEDERMDLLRRLVTADGPARADGPPRYLDTVAARLAADPRGVQPLLCRWFGDRRPLPATPYATVGTAAQALLHTHRAPAVDDLCEALVATAHPLADGLLTALAEDEPSAVCRAVDRWAHDDGRPERRAAAAAYGDLVAERPTPVAEPPSCDTGAAGPDAGHFATGPDPVRPTPVAEPPSCDTGATGSDAGHLATGPDPVRPTRVPDRPPSTAAGPSPAGAALHPVPSPPLAVPLRPPAPDAAHRTADAPPRPTSDDRQLLRYAALALLARPRDAGLHGRALGILIRDPLTRARHLPRALAEPGVPARALVRALPTDPEPVLAALRDRLDGPEEAAGEVLAALAEITAPALARRAAALVREYVDRHPGPGPARHAAAYADRRLEHGPAARAVLFPLVTGLLRDHPAHLRAAFAPVLAAPGTGASRLLRGELLDVLLRYEAETPSGPAVLDALLRAAARGCERRPDVRTRDLVHRTGLLLVRTPDGAARLDRRIAELAREVPGFAARLADGPPDGPAAWAALVDPETRRTVETLGSSMPMRTESPGHGSLRPA
ncbi:trypsin-like peptidase domain-containing protein [Streptomyces sp. NPDC054861]